MCMLLLDLVGLFAVIDSELPSVPSDTYSTVSTSMCNRFCTVRQKMH
jgi:hypothetical protein